jgi:hypothetical protein
MKARSAIFLAIFLAAAGILTAWSASALANELWVEPTAAAPGKKVGDWAVTSSADTRFSFAVPNNMQTFTGAKIVVIGSKDLSTTYDLRLSLSQQGKNYADKTNTSFGQSLVLSKNMVKEVDVSALFPPAMTAGVNYATLHFKAKSKAAQVLGLRFVYAGTPGDKGPTGDKGPIGDKGPVGNQGPVGNKGPSGDQGPVGFQGPVGSKGPTGDKGPVGNQGLVGLQGPAGDKGPTGDQGPVGPAGAGFNPMRLAMLRWYPAMTLNLETAQFTKPSGIASDGSYIYVSSQGVPGTVKVLFGSVFGAGHSGKIYTSVNVGNNPNGLICDGQSIWVANGGSNSVTKISGSGFTTATFGNANFGGPGGLAFDGTRIWVSNLNNNTLVALNQDGTQALSLNLSNFNGLHGIACDGKSIWVANELSNTVTKVYWHIGLPGYWAAVDYTVDNNPMNLCFDGTYIWVTCTAANSVRRIKVADGTVTPAIAGGLNGPMGFVFDGSYIWVTNYIGNSVSQFTTGGLYLGNYSTGAGSAPTEVAFDGQKIWTANYGTNNVTVH